MRSIYAFAIALLAIVTSVSATEQQLLQLDQANGTDTFQLAVRLTPPGRKYPVNVYIYFENSEDYAGTSLTADKTKATNYTLTPEGGILQLVDITRKSGEHITNLTICYHGDLQGKFFGYRDSVCAKDVKTRLSFSGRVLQWENDIFETEGNLAPFCVPETSDGGFDDQILIFKDGNKRAGCKPVKIFRTD